MQTQPLTLKDNRITLALLKVRTDFDMLAKLLGTKKRLKASLIEEQQKDIHQMLYAKLYNLKFSSINSILNDHLREIQPCSEE